MNPDSLSATSYSPRRAVSRRWLGVLIASLLLHVALLDWANGHIGLPSLPMQPDSLITAELTPVQTAPDIPPPKPQATPKPKPRPRPTPKPAAKPALPASLPSTQAQTSPPPPSNAGADVTVAAIDPPPVPASAEPAVSEPAPLVEPVAEPASKEPAEQRYKVEPPPSAELKYDVQALRDGQMVYGRGKLGWQADGNRYVASGEAGVLFFTVLNFKSEGELDEFGVAPVLYSEKRFRKSETNTHFHRERNTISFSASTASYPRKGGEQDRASIIWQLAGIGRGDSGKFVAGAEIDIFVAGVRDAETWRIQVIGLEDVTVGIGKINAWHVARVPRPGSYEQKLDIWLAPQQEWYPVKLRYTENNGDYLDMLLSNVNLTAAR